MFWNAQNLRKSANLTFLFPPPKSHKISDGITTIAHYFYMFKAFGGGNSDNSDKNELIHTEKGLQSLV